MAAAETLLVDRPASGVLRLRLDRPERMNAIDRPLVDALLRAFDGAADEGAVVLGSTSERAFCAGADLDLEDGERARVSDLLYELYEKMVTLPVPVVAAIDGHAVGAGMQLAVAADFRVAGRGAKLRAAGAGHGLAVASWGLPSLVGRGRALDLCLTMRTVVAEEARGIGLVDRLEEDPGTAAVGAAAGFAALDRPAAARVKRIAAGATGILGALRRERSENRESWSGSVEALAWKKGEG